jgi:polyferredoxin
VEGKVIMLKAKSKKMIDEPEIRFPQISRIMNKQSAVVALVFISLLSVYITLLGLRGQIDFLGEGDFIVKGFLTIVIFPLIVGLLTWGFMIVYSDHKNIAKDRFKAHKRMSLTDNRVGNWLIKKRWFQSILTIPNFAFFLLVVIVGMFGYGGFTQLTAGPGTYADSGFINGATFLTWNIWWVGMIFTFPLAGRLWCTMCPLGTVGEWAHRTHVPKHMTAMSLFLRYVSAALFAITGAMVVAVATGTIFFGESISTVIAAKGTDLKLIEGIMGPITGFPAFTSDPLGFLVKTLEYFTLAPGHVLTAFFDVAVYNPFPVGQAVAFLWATVTFFGMVISAILGFVVKDYLYQAFIGTPLAQVEDPKRPYPKRLRTLWITVILFAGTMIFDFAVGMFVNPLFTAFFIFLLIAASVVLGVIYERRAFCMYVCPLAGIIGTYGSAGAVELRNKDMAVCSNCKTKDCLKGRNEQFGTSAMSPDRAVNFEWSSGYACPMGEFTMVMESNLGCIMCSECLKSCRNDNINIAVRPPGLDLFLKKKKTFDEASLAAVLVGITLATVLPAAPEISGIISPAGPAIAEFLGVANFLGDYVVLVSWFIIAAFIFPIGLFFIASWFSIKLGDIKNVSVKEQFTTFAYAIIPIGLVTHAAFWVVRLFDHAPSALKVLMDPLGGEFFGFPLYEKSGDAVTVLLDNPLTFPIAIIYLLNPLFYITTNMDFPNLFHPDFTFLFRIGVLFMGLSYAIFAAYKTTLKKFGTKDPTRNFRIMLPLVGYMTVFTMISLFAARSWVS